MSVVRYRQDSLPPLTNEQKAELRAMAHIPPTEADLKEIPPLDDAAWDNAVRGRFFGPAKKVSIRIDADILAWLESQGEGYQTKINTILREAMLRS